MQQQRQGDSVLRQLAPYLTLGTQLAASVVVCGGIGWFADSKLESAPVGLVIGLVVGSVAGFVHFLRSVQQLLERRPPQQTEKEIDRSGH